MGCALKRLRDFGFNTDNKVYVVAEIGINHGGDIKTAERLIGSAASAGVDAVKFQTYITQKRLKKDSPIFDILKKCELPFKAFKELKDCAEGYNVEFFSTAFDDESIDYLESINVSLYKVASFDVINPNFLRKIAKTKKTVILSTGMSALDEIKKAYAILSEKTKNIALLHCISAYPTQANDANLAAIYSLKDNFDCVIGQSDHTDGIEVPLYAVAVGAQVIEKHYKISKEMHCVDASVSITEEQMKHLIRKIRRLEQILGEGRLGITDAQQECKIYRRQSVG
ncbi:MAG: N-acetylneuraminate synthase family protein [Candidatus Omnitrophota bacterium]|nr:N-acetylneuraminate synthase family protein [Candidatus Omnitrophota bacterium]